jgi:hypothetical protein
MITKKTTRNTVADAAMKKTTTTDAGPDNRRAGVNNVTTADNMKTGANTAAKTVPAPTREGVPHPAAAGASLRWTATRYDASPVKAAALTMNREAGMAMMKVAGAA